MNIKTKVDNSSLRQIFILSILLAVLLIGANFSKLVLPNSKESSYIKKVVTINDVFKHFENHLILISVNDDATNSLSDSQRKYFEKMNGKEISKLALRDSYVGIVKDGNFIQEKRHQTKTVDLKYGILHIKSAGFNAGKYSVLTIGEKQIDVNKRGINLFILQKGNIITYSFDFFEKENPKSSGLLHYVKGKDLEAIKIHLDRKAYNKISRKRNEAIKTKVLLTNETDFVPTKISYNNESSKGEIRLKGDWTDHLAGENWSFRVKLNQGNTLLGMGKFSLHHPRTRNYVGEWLFHRLLRDAGLIGLRYSFVRVELIITDEISTEQKDLGIYAIEEFFDKYLLEHNQRREGVLLKIDEDPLWQERADFISKKLTMEDLGYIKLHDYKESKVLPFSGKKVRTDSTLLQQFLIGRQLFKNYIKDSSLISETFDIEQLAKYNAICNLLGADHALLAHNYRAYYNPTTALLEPVGFDGNAFNKTYYPYHYQHATKDIAYMKAYVEALEEVTKEEYIKYISNYPQLREHILLMQSAFSDFNWDERILHHNRHVIQKMINPTHSLNIFFRQIKEEYILVNIENYGKFPVQINKLTTTDGHLLAILDNPIIIKGKQRRDVSFRLKKDYQRIFVNKKKRKSGFIAASDIQKLQIVYQTLGSSEIRKETILPWTNEGIALSKAVLLKQQANFKKYNFLYVDKNKKQIICKSGNWALKEPLIIPKGYKFIMSAGTSIELLHPRASIVSFSPVEFMGEPDNPIEIFSSTNIGGGLIVLNTQDTSILRNCKFHQLSSPITAGWVTTGAISFYRAPVKLTNCSVSKNRSEDAINVINTYFEMDNIVFSNTKSDAFDGDFVNGIVRNCIFRDIGNDGIDVSGANIVIENTIISKAGDKGISAGEKSKIISRNIVIKNSEVAIASKDQSVFNIQKAMLTNNKLAFTAYQKKSEFGGAKIIADSVETKGNEYDFLIEEKSQMKLNGKYIPTIPKVKERMYGIEFGKNSNR